MSCLAQAPLAPSLALPVVCVVMMVAIHCPDCCGSCKGSITHHHWAMAVVGAVELDTFGAMLCGGCGMLWCC